MDHPTDPGDARALMRDIRCRHPGFFEAVLAHRLAMALSQVAIGDPVVMHPGIYIVHGQVVLDGIVEVHGGAVISPWVTIGLRAGNVVGPKVLAGVSVGTGAKLIGDIEVGAGAVVGANSVVIDDVAPGTTVVGAPARPV